MSYPPSPTQVCRRRAAFFCTGRPARARPPSRWRWRGRRGSTPWWSTLPPFAAKSLAPPRPRWHAWWRRRVRPALPCSSLISSRPSLRTGCVWMLWRRSGWQPRLSSALVPRQHLDPRNAIPFPCRAQDDDEGSGAARLRAALVSHLDDLSRLSSGDDEFQGVVVVATTTRPENVHPSGRLPRRCAGCQVLHQSSRLVSLVLDRHQCSSQDAWSCTCTFHCWVAREGANAYRSSSPPCRLKRPVRPKTRSVISSPSQKVCPCRSGPRSGGILPICPATLTWPLAPRPPLRPQRGRAGKRVSRGGHGRAARRHCRHGNLKAAPPPAV